jgi:NADH-quinone oxidoreductase subunit M
MADRSDEIGLFDHPDDRSAGGSPVSELHLPWLELAIITPLIGMILVSRIRDTQRAREACVYVTGLALLLSVGAWADFNLMHASEADDHFHLLTYLFGRRFLVIDELSAPLLPMTALIFFLTVATTASAQLRRFSFGLALAAESITLAMMSCKEPWGVITLLALATLPPYFDLRFRGRSTRVFAIHMSVFVAMMVLGWSFVEREGGQHRVHTLIAIIPLLIAVFIRSGMVPFHCWMTDLFENASLGTALLFVTPMTDAYVAIRLLLPTADRWVLQSIGGLSLFTAVYAAGMATIQKDARRFFCYLFISSTSLVLVGMEVLTPTPLTGGLSVWLSSAIALTGFGLMIRAIEARRGRLDLTRFAGLYQLTPALAVLFLLTGLASIGFPGTVGFIGSEMIVDGVVETYPYVGVAVVIAGALNGIAIVRAYFAIFTGTVHRASVPLEIRGRERFVVLTIASLIFAGGIYPQFNVGSRHHAADELLEERVTDHHEKIEPSVIHAEP